MVILELLLVSDIAPTGVMTIPLALQKGSGAQA